MSGPKLFSDGCDKMRGACQQQCPAWPNKSRAHMEAVSTARLAVCARDPSAQLIRPADRALMPIPTSCHSDMIHRRYSIDRMVLCLVCVHACMQCMHAHALVPRPLQPASQLYMPMPACLPAFSFHHASRATESTHKKGLSIDRFSVLDGCMRTAGQICVRNRSSNHT